MDHFSLIWRIIMITVSIPKIVERLKKLPPDKLAAVYDFVSYLADRETAHKVTENLSEPYLTMLASQQLLKKDWELPEEDAAWANL
jgi:hypothetical protein